MIAAGSAVAACSSGDDGTGTSGPAGDAAAGATSASGGTVAGASGGTPATGSGGTSGGTSGGAGNGGSGAAGNGGSAPVACQTDADCASRSCVGCDNLCMRGRCCQLPEKSSAPGLCFARGPAFGPAVTSTCSPATPPPSQGGDIPDGLYALEHRVVYGTACAPDTRSATIVACGGRWAWSEIYSPKLDPDGGLASTQSPCDTSYAVTAPQSSALALTPDCSTCTNPMPVSLTYTYAAGVLTLSELYNGSTYVSTYALTRAD